ncbi:MULTISPECIES: CinA family nicotinamide mononucleotide deamidase-related protein [unclassified Photobacterium]|uniref:CinA family nicotinamide mononucleotide deamidase-related protein n=1 Tax=unclassified Photobacterium TaxID=2628852 RepID=UPI001EDFBBF7|nr:MULTISPECIES: CinA family nicotinamide mononucleotide deamidase-related protein [unclassified Photobacterium]MCG3863576.1 CinA family nicotinamide mononucleotide deamidase-related protein [Photobacterium sp. Ph6]MCG3875105.1 CinA family nicotinamide mononucleotide deamidase-related protein [Photobacterium sp. Ph5]
MLEITMISTGEEVLLGDITDTNATWLSRLFFQHGFPMTRRITVGDHCERLAKEIESCSFNSDIVIVNGGLGPTSDDLSAAAAAMAADVGLEQSEHWVLEMKAKYKKLNREMPAANLKQAMLPEGAELIDNPVGTACGFSIKLNRAWICFTPGVPSEFKFMVKEQILPYLQSQYPQIQSLHCHRLFTYGLSESGISDTFKHIVLPQGYELGYRSSLPFIEVKLFAPSNDRYALELLNEMERLLGDNIVGKNLSLLDNLSYLLEKKQKKIGLLEYSTGGFVVNWLNQRSSLSEYITSATVNHNAAKEKISSDMLMAEMNDQLSFIHHQSKVDIGLYTGVIKGDCFTVGIITSEGRWYQQLQFKREYTHNDQRWIIATVLLDMLRRQLEGIDVFGHYESLNRILKNHSL